MKKAVIFDLDGTLLNTCPDLMVAMNQMLDKFGFPRISEREVISYIGYGAEQYVKCAIPKEHWDKTDECLRYYSKVYDESGSPLTRLYDGIDELLKNLKRAGLKLMILSNKPQTSTNEVYKRYLSSYAFDYVYGQREGIKAKPDPEPLYVVLKETGLNKEEIVFVGDGETDIGMAKNAGADSVGVLWGYRSKAQLMEAGGKVFASSPEELYRIIVKWDERLK